MICVAGGSGLAPLHAILLEANAADVTRDCTVLFGARTAADLYYLDELAALGARWRGRFSVLPVLSMEPPTSDWQGLRGLVTEALAPLAGNGFHADDQGYLCGPPAMVDAGVAELRRLGMRTDAVFCDRFLDASTQPGGREAVATNGTGE
jgi:p-cymene monooxygenase electron transfer component